jgi:hypothetical protein
MDREYGPDSMLVSVDRLLGLELYEPMLGSDAAVLAAERK